MTYMGREPERSKLAESSLSASDRDVHLPDIMGAAVFLT
jgi:hypothetical protein